jgi:hypothetical protein
VRFAAFRHSGRIMLYVLELGLNIVTVGALNAPGADRKIYEEDWLWLIRWRGFAAMHVMP